mgnify:CR=1 FL=1
MEKKELQFVGKILYKENHYDGKRKNACRTAV